jgi:hypothetical protein
MEAAGSSETRYLLTKLCGITSQETNFHLIYECTNRGTPYQKWENNFLPPVTEKEDWKLTGCKQIRHIKTTSTLCNLCGWNWAAGWTEFDTRETERFLSTLRCQDWLGPTQQGAIITGVRCVHSVKLASHLHLVPKLRMHGSIPPLVIHLNGIAPNLT